MIPVPATIDDITAEWMTSALAPRLPGVKVGSVTVEEVFDGTATKVFVRLGYGPDGGPPGAPETLCIKGGLKENRDLMAPSRIYEREAVYYRDIAPIVPSAGAAAWAAIADATTHLGVVVLEDLRGQATFCRATSPLSIDAVAGGLELIAGYHAATWNAPMLHEHPTIEAFARRDNSTGLYFTTMDADRLDHFLSLPLRAAAIPPELHDPGRIIDLFWRWVDRSQEGPWVLTHGDAHIGNWFQRPDGSLGLVDWQTMCRMRPAHDVAYFVASALTTADRRFAERDLVAGYRACLVAAGVDAPPLEVLWVDYRRHMAYGLMAWLTSLEWMNPEEIHAAAVGRFAHAVLDLDVSATLR